MRFKENSIKNVLIIKRGKQKNLKDKNKNKNNILIIKIQ